VPLVGTAHRVNLVVIAHEVKELVLHRVLENRVKIIPTAGQVNHVVVLIEYVPQVALENFVP
jgi:hypothetical protein